MSAYMESDMARAVNEASMRGAYNALLAVQKHGFDYAIECYIPQELREEPDTLSSCSQSKRLINSSAPASAIVQEEIIKFKNKKVEPEVV